MTMLELKNLFHKCYLERTQLPTILTSCVQSVQLAGSVLTGNRNNLLKIEGSTS